MMTRALGIPFCALSTIADNMGSIHRIVRETGDNEFFGSTSPVLFVSRVRHFSGDRRSSLLKTIRGNVIALVNTAARGPSFRMVHPLLSHYRLCILGPLRGRSLRKLLRQTIARSIRLGRGGVRLGRATTVLHFDNNSTQGLLGVLRLIIRSTNDSRIIVASGVMRRRLRRGPLTCSGRNRVRCSVVSTFVGDVQNDSPSTTLC